MAGHDHNPSHTHDDHGGHGHHHHATGPTLRLALALTLGYAVVEVVGGLWSGSLALLGDAGHMFTDAVALGLAAAAAWLATRPPSALHSYGLGRAEVVAALLNALFMLLVVIAIGSEAIGRLYDPQPVAGRTVMVVAGIGLAINALVAVILSRGENTLNVRAALLHVMGDLLGSVAALTAGVVIHHTGWTPIDPLLALFVCLLILYSTLQILRESLHVVMEGVPLHINLPAVGMAMARMPQVVSIHDLHIWTLTSGKVALSAHVVMDDLRHWEATLTGLNHLLHDEFGIEHTTLQPESRTAVIHWRPPE